MMGPVALVVVVEEVRRAARSGIGSVGDGFGMLRVALVVEVSGLEGKGA